LEAHPLATVLISLPGIGVRTAARILIDVGDASRFPTAGHLAAYAGLAPATRSSGSSIRGEHPAQRGNKQLKRALLASITCLARRRIDVHYAMLRDGTLHQARTLPPT
jgi:transposase